MKRLIEIGRLIPNKPKPVTKKFMDKWENEVKDLIYPERMGEWREVGAGVWSGIISNDNIEEAISVMEKLHQGQDIEKIKKQIKKIDKSKGIETEKVLNTVLHFSKKGPEFFSNYYNITDTFCNQKIRIIENENYEFEKNFQNRNKQNQKEREQ